MFFSLLPILTFGLLAFVPMFSDGDDMADTADDAFDDNEADSETLVSLTDSEGTLLEQSFGAADQPDGEPIVVDGTDGNDTIQADLAPTVDLKLNGNGGDDAISFGYGTSVDGGEGSDVLDLTLTDEALADGTLEAGVVTFSDSTDALAISIENGEGSFLHEVQITRFGTPADGTETETVNLYYILSPSETLDIDETESAATGIPVLGDNMTLLVEIDLGSQTTVSGTDDLGNPTETVTGEINRDPVIALSEVLASSVVLQNS